MTLSKERMQIIDVVAGIGLTLLAIAIAVYVLVGREGFDFSYIVENYQIFLNAARVTIAVTTVSFALGSLIGFLVGWARAARPKQLAKVLRDRKRLGSDRDSSRGMERLELTRVALIAGGKYSLRRIADGFVAVMRGTPLFLQIIFAWSIMIVYFPQLNNLTLILIAGIAAMTANTAAYQSEIYRAGLQTVQAGQVEAARSVGLSRWGAMRRVVLPQALRLVIPPLTNEYIGLLKASSLLFLIGIAELTLVGKEQAFISARVFEVFALVAGIYFLITVPLSKIVEYLERRYRIPGLGIQTVRSGRARQ